MVAQARSAVERAAERAEAEHLVALRVGSGTWTVPSGTRPGVGYMVRLHANGELDCDCPAGSTDQVCKHVAAVRAAIDAEATRDTAPLATAEQLAARRPVPREPVDLEQVRRDLLGEQPAAAAKAAGRRGSIVDQPGQNGQAVKREFVIERQGREFVLYAGLLDLAHRSGLQRITTKLLQVPSEENGHVAICSGEVETTRGVFSGIGDAAPSNVARAMLTVTIRLAETRAKARALRDAVNVGVVAFEELAGDDLASELAAHGHDVVDRRTGEISSPRSTSTADSSSSAAQATVHELASRRAASEAAAATRPATGDRASSAQLAAIASIARARGVSDEIVDSALLVRWGARRREELGKRQASEVIDALKADTL